MLNKQQVQFSSESSHAHLCSMRCVRADTHEEKCTYVQACKHLRSLSHTRTRLPRPWQRMEKITVYINTRIPNSQTLLEVPPTSHSILSVFLLFWAPPPTYKEVEVPHFGGKEAERNVTNMTMTYLWFQHLHVNMLLLNRACRLNICVWFKESHGLSRWQEIEHFFLKCFVQSGYNDMCYASDEGRKRALTFFFFFFKKGG